jgi:hypothetical protein
MQAPGHTEKHPSYSHRPVCAQIAKAY